jgi:hypothetical protein
MQGTPPIAQAAAPPSSPPDPPSLTPPSLPPSQGLGESKHTPPIPEQQNSPPVRDGPHAAWHSAFVLHTSDEHIPPPIWQVPLTQVDPAAHALPQRPQLALSDETSMQLAPHIIRGAVHPPAMQTPIVQVWPAAHMRPHAPQLALLFVTSTHAPPQFICGAVQFTIAWQRPAMHVCPDWQRALQAPQCKLDVCKFTQSVPQRVAPVGQFIAASMPLGPESAAASARVLASRVGSSSRGGPQALRAIRAAAPSNQGERMRVSPSVTSRCECVETTSRAGEFAS